MKGCVEPLRPLGSLSVCWSKERSGDDHADLGSDVDAFGSRCILRLSFCVFVGKLGGPAS